MRKIAVVVATTGGPARVERVTRERAAQSMACLKRSSTVLPISGAYDDFVRPGSGVIEREFGPFEEGAFRLDVSAPIGGGESWQLGFFVAHAVAAASDVRLAGPDEEPDAVAWLTGRVDCDLNVGSVGHLAEKLHASREDFARWTAAGTPVTLFVHAGTDRETIETLDVASGMKIKAVSSAREALAELGLALSLAAHAESATTAPGTGPPTPSQGQDTAFRMTSRRWIAAAAIVAAASFMAIAVKSKFWETRPVPPQEASKQEGTPAPVETALLTEPAASRPAGISESAPAMQSVALSILERRAPPGRTCADIQFGRVEAVTVPIPASGDEARTTSLAGLCGLAFEIDNGKVARFVAVSLDVLSGRLLLGTVKPPELSGETPFAGRREWAIDLPRRMTEPFEFRVVAVAGDRPVANEARWIGARGDTAAALAEPAAKGLAAQAIRHRVTP